MRDIKFIHTPNEAMVTTCYVSECDTLIAFIEVWKLRLKGHYSVVMLSVDYVESKEMIFDNYDDAVIYAADLAVNC